MIVSQQFPSQHLIDMLPGTEYFKEKVNETVMVIEANISVLTKFRTYYYESLAKRLLPLTHLVVEPIDDFSRRVNDAIYELNMQCSRTKLLAQITGDRKGQVSIQRANSGLCERGLAD